MAEKEIHNVCTIYGANPNGSESKTKLASLGQRPQDWGHPRWHYEQVRFQHVTNGNGYQEYVFVWHLWTDLKRKPHEMIQMFGSIVLMQTLPGMTVQQCGRSHLLEDDFWEPAWGPKPAFFELEPDWYEFGEP